MKFIGKCLELKIIILSEIPETQKDKYCMYYPLCGG